MEIGTVYGPLPMRISLGGLSVMRAGVDDDGTGAGAAPAAGGAVGGGGCAGVGAGVGGGAEATGGSIGETTMLLAAGAVGADGTMTIPGMGELPGGTTGRCVPAGCAAVGDNTAPGAVSGEAGAVSGEAAAADAAPAAGSSPPITAGGPPSVMLLCVPM